MQREIAHDLATGERRSNDVAPGKVKSFTELNLRHEIVRGLQRRNFQTPTMIQAAAIPMALSRKDMLVQSKSGTGKTLIYAIAVLQGLDASVKTPQALVVVPTRELAIQVQETFGFLGEFLPKLKAVHFIGGTDISTDRKRINNCSIVIGTPGRLLHLYRNHVLCVSNLTTLVLDEADQLYLREGLQKQVNELTRDLPMKIQRIACSATYEMNLDEKLAKSMNKPVLISNSERATVLLGIRQFVHELPKQVSNIAEMNCKLDAVINIFKLVSYGQVVLFASSKMRADSFRNYLIRRGVECHLITGAMDQEERAKVFDCYRFFSMRTLVATDLFARGVDSPHTNLIVNLDPPKDHVDYLHRIGRAGRFGSKGIAISLVYEGAESERFKRILCKTPTGKSVLKFPQELAQDFDFWNFQAYNFPYYITDETIPDDPNHSDDPKVDYAQVKDAPMKGSPKNDKKTTNESVEDKEASEAVKNKEEELVTRVVSHNLIETIQDALIEDQVENSEVKLEIKLEANKSAIEIFAETSSPSREQPPPLIKLNEIEIKCEVDKDLENQQNNKKIQKPEEFISPELTPSSLTPLDLTQEPTSSTKLTAPAPPVNSVNNKTYCLVAPTATSSMTLQAMVMSNTVDDASSISSDGSMGSRSESFSSVYTTSDETRIWKKFLKIQKRLFRSGKCQDSRIMYRWYSFNFVPYVKRKRKSKPWKTQKDKSLYLLLNPKYLNLLKKIKSFLKRICDYSKRCRMTDLYGKHFFKNLYNAYDALYNFKSISEPRMSQENKPQNKLSVHVTHQLNIPPLPAVALGADENPAIDSDANEESQDSVEFSDDEDDYEEEEDTYSSSGFVESNESASSGIDTSEYGTESSTEDDQDYEDTDDDDDDSFDPMNDSEITAEDVESYKEDEDENEDEDEDEDIKEDTGSNVSLAGTSFNGSVSAEEDVDDNLNAEELQPEELDAEEPLGDAHLKTLAMYQQMFETQYEFIVSHVASLLANP